MAKACSCSEQRLELQPGKAEGLGGTSSRIPTASGWQRRGGSWSQKKVMFFSRSGLKALSGW